MLRSFDGGRGICAERSLNECYSEWLHPIGKNGDNYDRYLNAHGRNARSNNKIMKQCIEKMPKGP